MNSEETYSLYRWNSINIEFMDNDFDRFIDEASPYSSITSVLRESIGGELDFKLKLKNENPSDYTFSMDLSIIGTKLEISCGLIICVCTIMVYFFTQCWLKEDQ